MKRIIHGMFFAAIGLILILSSCDQKRPPSSLSEQEIRSIFLVMEGMLFLAAPEDDFKAYEEYAEKVFQQVDEHYHLAKEGSIDIYMEGRKRKWQLSMARRVTLLAASSDKKTWTVKEVQDVLAELPTNNQTNKDRIGNQQTVASLVEELKHAKNSYARYDCIGKLVDYGELAVDPLIADLKDPDAYVRGFAAFGLGKIGDKRAVGPLIQLLQDEGIFDFGDGTYLGPLLVAHSAAEALTLFEDQSAVPHLHSALGKAKARLKVAEKLHYEITSPTRYLASLHLVVALEGALEKMKGATEALESENPLSSLSSAASHDEEILQLIAKIGQKTPENV